MVKREKLQVYTYKRKYIDIVNSSILFLLDPEEMKNCLYRVETRNAGSRL